MCQETISIRIISSLKSSLLFDDFKHWMTKKRYSNLDFCHEIDYGHKTKVKSKIHSTDNIDQFILVKWFYFVELDDARIVTEKW